VTAPVLALCVLVVGCASSDDYRRDQAWMAQRYRACQADRGTDCSLVGDWLVHQVRYDEARAVYLHDCERGEVGGCMRAIERFGEPLLARACKLSVTPCVEAALSSTVTPAERQEAITQVCTKLPERCAEVFERSLRRGEDVSARAKILCTPPGLEPRICGALGLLAWPDPAIGIELLGRACSNGDARACWQLSRRSHDVAAAQRACKLEHPGACDPDTADQVLEGWRARCRENDATACETLGRLLSTP